MTLSDSSPAASVSRIFRVPRQNVERLSSLHRLADFLPLTVAARVRRSREQRQQLIAERPIHHRRRTLSPRDERLSDTLRKFAGLEEIQHGRQSVLGRLLPLRRPILLSRVGATDPP